MKRPINYSTPLIMGILNVTPDSFYDGGKYLNVQNALTQAGKMVNEGVDIIDIGAMSSRPGAAIISPMEELARLKEILLAVRATYPNILISVDTIQAEVADYALSQGADILNDISGFEYDPELIDVIVKHNKPYILMHMQGLPGNMQQSPHYEDVSMEILQFFIEKLDKLRQKGFYEVIIDPGFGFGKTIDHNFTLVKDLGVFKILGKPILAGISRKSSISKLLEIDKDKTLPATTALHLQLLLNGANLLRVHDVKEAKQAVTLFQKLSL